MGTLGGNPSKETAAALVELRNRLTIRGTLEPTMLCRDVFLLRYLWNTRNNVDSAERMIECYASYLNEVNVEKLIASISPPEISSNFQCLLGATDYENRPVLQLPCNKRCDLKTCIENGGEPNFEQFFMKVHWTVEKIMLKNDSDFAVLVVDLKNISYGQFLHRKSFMTIMHVVQKIQKFSPGTVQRAIVINAPRIIRILVAAARKLITIHAEIIVLAENDPNWKERIREYVPLEQLCPEFGGSSSSCYSVT